MSRKQSESSEDESIDDDSRKTILESEVEESNDKVEEIDLPKKKRGRPKKSKNVSPCSDQKGKIIQKHVQSTEDSTYSSSEEEDPIHPTTKFSIVTPMKIEKDSEREESFKNTTTNIKAVKKLDSSMQSNLALMRQHYAIAPPKDVRAHYETFTMYYLEDPSGNSNYFVAVAVLLNNTNKQPSAFLKSVWFRESLIGLAGADKQSTSVAKYRGALENCTTITFRKIEHGDNEPQYHEYNNSIYYHDAVMFMIKRDPADAMAIPNFVEAMKEILRSDMFFASFHEITMVSSGSGRAVTAMRDPESAVWRYLKNPQNLTVVQMTTLDQILLDEDIMKVLKKMYKKHWQDYFNVGWSKNISHPTKNEYPIFKKK